MPTPNRCAIPVSDHLVRCIWSSTVLIPLLAAPVHASDPPQPIYPAGDATAKISQTCPTLIWSQVPHAQHYEIAIYRASEDEAQLLYTVPLPAGTGAWTPLDGQCLEAGEIYAWAIRAALSDALTAWSQVQFFAVTRPSPSDVASALEDLRRYLRDHDEADTPDGGAAQQPAIVPSELLRQVPPPGPTDTVTSPTSTEPASSPPQTTVARTTAPDVGIRATGDAFGVLGNVFSSEGVGVGGYAVGAGVNAGVQGITTSTQGYGVFGLASAKTGLNRGVYGTSRSTAGVGVYGYAEASIGSNIGVLGVTNSPSGHAGFFAGNVLVAGTLVKTAGSFKIDHPLDPANRYLAHSFVESPDMLNIYNGDVVLDGEGAAWVQLPEWFEALNRDFHYQLTPIGQPAPSLFVSVPIRENRFQIDGGEPGMRVSWQVTGVRHDAYARAHPIVVEEDKGSNRGYYLHPALFGKTAECAISSATLSGDAPPCEGRLAETR